MKEYRDLTSDPLQDTITAGPVSEDNMLVWEALIQGPEDTPYVGSTGVELIYRKGACLSQSSSL
jgi:ubiquitin-protein ligase